MDRRYATPHVVEIRRDAQPESPPPDVQRPAQRALVESSLLRCP